jgi:hypothetical protein
MREIGQQRGGRLRSRLKRASVFDAGISRPYAIDVPDGTNASLEP